MPTPTFPKVSKLLRTADVAQMLGVAPRTVCLWAECSQLPAVKVGRQWRFEATAIAEYLQCLATNAPVFSSESRKRTDFH